jgi:Ca2+/Na+ antiporter
MLKNLMHDAVLSVQSRTGITSSFIVGLCVIAVAGITAFAFLCVASYAWLSTEIGGIYAGLILAGVFFLIAAIGVIVCALSRRRARERAILERAARAHTPSWLLDPRVLATAVQIGREFGWQRIIPVALVGFMAAQWAREQRRPSQEPAE